MIKTTMKTNQNYKEQFRCSVAGVQYSDYQKINCPKIGKHLGVFLEKKNKFDNRAIRLEYDGIKIGYIPKGNLQEKIHTAFNLGLKIKIILTAVNKNNPSWHLFTVAVLTNKDIGEAEEISFNTLDYDWNQYEVNF